MESKRKKLLFLHEKIYQCRLCQIGYDEQRAERVLEKTEILVMIIGQSLANRTQRLSGLPYRFPDGRLSQTGQRLNDFLASIGCGIESVYLTDVVKCYQGKKGKNDREPASLEIDHCSRWLMSELIILEPEVVITLGKIAERCYLWIAREIGISPAHFAIPHPAYFRWKPVETTEIYRHTAKEIKDFLQRKGL